jgi:8-oxo-dGTP pyrophosphatase MutT (NUDIX family)
LLRFFQAHSAYFQDDFKATLMFVFSHRHLFMKQITPQTPPTRWKPSVTVAAIIEKEGKFLLIEEHTPEGLRLNNPAGHLDPGESPIQACAREALEESAHDFQPTGLIGMYLSRFQRTDSVSSSVEDVTYLRFAFSGELGAFHPLQPLDKGIVRTLWLSPDEIRASVHLHRSPLLLQCMKDYLQGQRYGLEMIYTDPSVYL